MAHAHSNQANTRANTRTEISTTHRAQTYHIPGRYSQLARLALHSMYTELALYPKPGLVSLVDSGSHDDMNAETFLRSLFALRHYFQHIARAGAEGASFAHLQQLGIAAEERMLQATKGINTHRGAIFSLGLLCAASQRCIALGLPRTPIQIRAQLLSSWGQALAKHHSLADSHGAQVAQQFGFSALSGAREEAARGFPSVFELALPHLHQLLANGRSMPEALLEVFFVLLTRIHDTNVLYRGGLAGAAFVKHAAVQFLAQGGTAQEGWFARAHACHQSFVAAKLSPGGAADLLAATHFVYRLVYQLGEPT